MNKLFAFIQESWERLVLILAILLFCVSIVWRWHRMTDMPQYHEHKGDVPAMPEYYDWAIPAERYFQPSLPETFSPNPFQVFLKVKELPPPPPPPPPPQEVKPPEPPPPPPKVVEKYIVKFCGTYSPKQDEIYIILEAAHNDRTERVYLRQGERWLDKFTVIAYDPNTITVQATNGQTHSIPWNKTAEFEY